MLIIYGNAGKLTKLGIPQQSQLIKSNDIPLQSEHTHGTFGLLAVKIENGNIIYYGYVFDGNEAYVKKFNHVSVASLYGDEAYSILEISLTTHPKLSNTTLHTEEISMADFQNKPYAHFAEQPSVAGQKQVSSEDYDQSGFENFNNTHLAMRGNADVTGGVDNDLN